MPAATATTLATASQQVVVTNIPLTTVYTPPSFCSTVPYTYYAQSSGTSLFWKNIDNLDDRSTSKCYPPNYALQHSTSVSAQYSPGICPSGYSGVSASLVSGVHTSICCPSGASWVAPGGCYSTVTTSTTAVVQPSTTIIVNKPAIFLDWYIQVAWAASDLDSFTPASAPALAIISSKATASGVSFGSPTASATPGSVALLSESASASASATPTTSNSGLSGGAIAGIVIGAIAGMLLILAGVFFFLWRRKRAARTAAAAAAPAPTVMDSTRYAPVAELDSRGAPAELAGGNGHGEYYNKINGPVDEKVPERPENRSELPTD